MFWHCVRRLWHRRLTEVFAVEGAGRVQFIIADLIQQTKAEIIEAKRFAAEGRWEEVMALAGQKKARGTRNVEVDYQEKSITL